MTPACREHFARRRSSTDDIIMEDLVAAGPGRRGAGRGGEPPPSLLRLGGGRLEAPGLPPCPDAAGRAPVPSGHTEAFEEPSTLAAAIVCVGTA
ncbi:hypothetical protein EYF80_039967 [Liparis tanakae]|uniref:Uncharacterized protein n=1 Tax=Liparis tanakae TaxID=230148 RepID=A0A4Z2GA41_9TELE|nr:hypothetical protein EYF80_039967 [Liparis tanakae]